MNQPKTKIEDLRSWPANLPLHAKITYLGDQEKPVPSVFFHSAGTATGYEVFVPCQSEGVDYSNDTVGNAGHFFISKQEQSSVLANLAAITPVSPPGAPRWAFVMVQISPSGPRSIEWLTQDGGARQIVNAITRGLASENELGRQILSRMPLR
jgi:hypothetical protein